MLTARGSRETESGIEKIVDPSLLERLQNQAHRVTVRALALAVLLTALALMLPE